MTQFYLYRDAFGVSSSFSVPLAADRIRLGELAGLVEMAEHLQTGTSVLTFDDPDADMGSGGDAVRANARLNITETACPAGNQRLYSGIFGTRTYRRGEFITGSSREIDGELHDLNILASMRVIPNSDRTAIRPAESVTARMTWLLGTGYMTLVVDAGFVDANATQMTKADYRGQHPANVVNDCEMAAGFGWNAFIYWNEATAEPALFFQNANTSTDYTSTLRLSNVLADADTFTDPAAVTFLPSVDAELRRDPSDLGSGVYLPFENGAVYRTSAATIDAYGRKDIVAPNSNVKSRNRARDQADDFLFQHATEEDRITVTVELPPSHVNLIRAGHRIQVRFQHLPGYEAFRWCRVLMRAPAQTKETDDRYFVRLELSPQEVPCSDSVTPTFVQVKQQDETLATHAPDYSEYFVLDAPSTIGNMLILATQSPVDQNAGVTAAPTGWSWALVNEPNEVSGGAYCNVFYKTSTGEDTVSVQFDSPNGPRRVVFAEYTGLNNPVLVGSVTMDLDDPGSGFAVVPPVSYPAGPTAVIGFVFMNDGPQASDDLFIEVGTATLRTPIDGGLHGTADLGMADQLLNTTAGSVGWQFGNCGAGATLAVGMAFEGSDCV